MGLGPIEESKISMEVLKALDARDAKKAAEILQEAVNRGSEQSMYQLGTAYLDGFGVPQDTDRGMELLRRAADQGVEQAKTKLKELAKKSRARSKPAPSSSSSSGSVNKTGGIFSAVIGIAVGIGFLLFCASLIKTISSSLYMSMSSLYLLLFFAVGFVVSFIAVRNKKVVLILVSLLFAGLGFYGTWRDSKGLTPLPFSKSAITTAVTEQAPAKTVTVTNEVLNIRAEASAQADILKKLKKGDVLTVTGEADNGWLPIEYEGTKGWVSGDMVE